MPATKATPSPRPPRADAVRNREAVLDAARKVMSDEGLDAGMDDIARAAKVGVGTVYRHFPTKDDLIAALADYRFEKLAEFARDSLEEEDPVAAFDRFIMRGGELQATDRALAQVMSERGELMSVAANRVGMLELTTKVLKRAQKAGAIRSDIRPEDIPMFMCGLGSLTSGHAAPFRGPNSWKRYLGIVLDGMRAGAGTNLPPHS